jgi:hypothetical protein
VFHYNVNFTSFLVDKVVMILNNCGMLKFAQNIYFSYDLLLFFFVHLAIVKFFPDKYATIAFATYFAYAAKTTYHLELDWKIFESTYPFQLSL